MRVACGAGPFDPRERHFLCPSCGLPLLARYDLAAARAWTRESLAGRAPNMWRYRELMPLLPGDEPVTLGEGFTPLLHAKRLGRLARSRPPVHQGRIAQPDQLVQSARAVGGHHARQGAGRRHHRAADRRQRRQCGRRLFRRRRTARARSSFPGTPSSRSSTSAGCTAPNVTLVDGLITDAGRMAAETGQAARLVRRVDAEGAVSRRRQEDDGIRAGGTVRLDAARLDRLSHRRRHRPRRHVESVRRARGDWLDRRASGRGWCRCRPTDARRSFARSSKARRRPAPWENAHTVADGLRVPRAIGDFLILRGGARAAAAPRSPSPTPRWCATCSPSAAHEGVSAAPEGGAALTRDPTAGGRRQDRARRDRGAVQHRRRARIPRCAGSRLKTVSGRPWIRLPQLQSPNATPIARAVLQQVVIERHGLGLADHVRERNRHDVGRIVRDHPAEDARGTAARRPSRRTASPAPDRRPSARRRAEGDRARRSASPCPSSPEEPWRRRRRRRRAARRARPCASSINVTSPPCGFAPFGHDDDAELAHRSSRARAGASTILSRSYGISGIRMTSAPPATPACSAIQPA